jgi:hypothetical protein
MWRATTPLRPGSGWRRATAPCGAPAGNAVRVHARSGRPPDTPASACRSRGAPAGLAESDSAGPAPLPASRRYAASVPLRSSSGQSPDLVFPGLFLPCSRPWLLTTAAEGGLDPASASRFRGASPHRSSSYTHWALLGPLRSWSTIVRAVDRPGPVLLPPFGGPPAFRQTVHGQVGERWAGHSAWGCPAVVVLPAGQPAFAVLIPLLDRNCKPHLDRTRHIPTDDSPGRRIEAVPDAEINSVLVNVPVAALDLEADAR